LFWIFGLCNIKFMCKLFNCVHHEKRMGISLQDIFRCSLSVCCC
jgi:hypothetical protein